MDDIRYLAAGQFFGIINYLNFNKYYIQKKRTKFLEGEDMDDYFFTIEQYYDDRYIYIDHPEHYTYTYAIFF